MSFGFGRNCFCHEAQTVLSLLVAIAFRFEFVIVGSSITMILITWSFGLKLTHFLRFVLG